MKRKIIAIAGRPGTGKTTLMREFMSSDKWERQSPAKLVETMRCEDRNLDIIGKYEDGVVFAGTDKLSMACQPEVLKWLQSTTSDVIYEGDRLTGTKFYDALLALPDTDVLFIVMTADEAILQERYKERGSDQNETFLQGRATKIENILSNFDYMSNIVEMKNNTPEDQAFILNAINGFLNGPR